MNAACPDLHMKSKRIKQLRDVKCNKELGLFVVNMMYKVQVIEVIKCFLFIETFLAEITMIRTGINNG